ncbi:MAG: MFS transporter [Clostridia bacterium]|nr:MFS transporter [Clostridia bacterium]
MDRFRPAGRGVFSATLSSYVMMALYAVLLNMFGEMLPSIIEDFGISLSKAGLLQTSFNIGGMATLAALIFFSDRIRKSRLVYFSFTIIAATLVITGLFARSYILLTAAYIILGSTTKVFDVSVNIYINDINTSGREFFLQVLHVCFGIGAVLGPLFGAAMAGTALGWKSAFLVLGGVCLAMIFISFVTLFRTSDSFEANVPGNQSESMGITQLLKEPQVWVLTFGSMCFSGSYVALVTWFPTYAAALANDTRKYSGLIISMYFLGFVLSRILASFILTQKNARRLIIITAFAGSMSLLAAYILGQTWSFFVFFPAAGFFSGATLPIIIFVGCVSFPRNTGGVTSMLYIGGSLSAMVLPYVIGVIGDSSGIAGAMPLTAYIILAAAFAAFLIKRRDF